MAQIITNIIARLNPAALTGPIFEKELLVSSRRKRNYYLRFVYLALLTIFVGYTWYNIVGEFSNDSAVYRASHMAEAGIAITATIVWSQFIMIQLVAVSLLSGAISDETNSRTLGALMTTPISSLQIVLGKLFSRLLQLFLLLALSLPILAIVRVLGGVLWGYIISSLCITFTAMLLAGSLSLLFSIDSKKSSQASGAALATLFIFYGLIPLLLTWLIFENHLSQNFLDYFLCLTNPFYVLTFNTGIMFSTGAAVPIIPWWVHCLFSLGVSVAILAFATVRVRKAALAQLFGKSKKSRKKLLAAQSSNSSGLPSKRSDKISHVKGHPIAWKDLITFTRKQTKTATNRIAGGMVLIGALSLYALCFAKGWFKEEVCQFAYILVYMVVLIICNATMAAESITSEKESQTWPLLLNTSLTDWQIIFGKYLGVLRRCLPIYILLAAHLLLFTLLGYIHPSALFHLLLIVIGIFAWFAGSGMFFSTLTKKTSTAISLTIFLSLMLGLFIPICGGVGTNGDAAEVLFSANPLVQTGVVLNETLGERNVRKPVSHLRYEWPTDKYNFRETTLIISPSTFFYLVAGFFFTIFARGSLRRNIFAKT
ncbi:MAG: ABC transporter permease subunit [Sedimentisphaerales bacterium]|nr:ABC transporter permease subunit [Sedimentisphaerales bacterium]